MKIKYEIDFLYKLEKYIYNKYKYFHKFYYNNTSLYIIIFEKFIFLRLI